MAVPYDEVADLLQHKTDVQAMFDLCAALGLNRESFDLALDLGGGLGLHALFLQLTCSTIYVADVISYNSLYGGTLVKEVMEKCARNNLMLRPQSIEFHNIDGRNTIYRDGLFDLVFSVNAFEHIPDPILAFQEAIRVCKPGGLVYLKFDPLWHSAYGHHMFAFDFDPWEHLLLSDEEFKRKIVQKGGSEKDIYVYDHDMNRKKYDVFKSLMTPPPPGVFSTFHFDRWSKTPEEDPYAGHPNYEACLKKGFDAEDLLTRGILFTGIRESY